MMIICFECNPSNKQFLDDLVSSGAYKNYNEMINAAIQNLSMLESAIKESGGLVIDNKGSTYVDYTFNKKQRDGDISDSSEKEYIKRRFSLLRDIPVSVTLPEIPKDSWLETENIPVDNWLWGQFNRFLPVKISCRSLANHLIQSKNGLPISEIPMTVAREALECAKYLREIEEKNKLGRDELLTVALPSLEKDEEKSLLRFANQYVVGKNSNNDLQGFLFGLKLINYSTQNDSEYISLTKPGWEFALLKNPILDEQQEFPSQKLSTQEKQFLIEHIKTNVPTEKYAYTIVLDQLNIGNNTPDKLDEAIETQNKEKSETNISRSFLSTQRSGVISRMIGLDLVERIREGIRVKYKSTNEAKNNFLK